MTIFTTFLILLSLLPSVCFGSVDFAFRYPNSAPMQVYTPTSPPPAPTIQNAKADNGTTKGIASFNSTNFTDSTGTINTIQNINSTATPTFGGATLNGLATISRNAIGTVVTDAVLLSNSTAAALNSQQASPSLHFRGNGWKTTATAASQSVDMYEYLLPVQGTTNPSGLTVWQSAINGGSKKTLGSISTGGIFTFGDTAIGGRTGVFDGSTSNTYLGDVDNIFGGPTITLIPFGSPSIVIDGMGNGTTITGGGDGAQIALHSSIDINAGDGNGVSITGGSQGGSVSITNYPGDGFQPGGDITIDPGADMGAGAGAIRMSPSGLRTIFGGPLTISANSITTDTTTGMSFGTATNQKVSIHGVTPKIQSLATTDLGVVLSDFGARAVGTAYPMTTTGAVDLSGATLKIPTGSSPTVTAAGALAQDTTDQQLLLGDGSNPIVVGVKKQSAGYVIDAPTSSLVFPLKPIPYNITITKIWAWDMGGTSLTFNIQKRASASLNSAGTNIMTSSLVATQTGVSTTTFSAASLSAQDHMVFVASAMSGTVSQVVIEVDYTIDRT